MKNIKIMSHAQLESYTMGTEVGDFVAVVVYSDGKKQPRMHENNHMLDVTFHCFDDVDDDNGMKAKQAEAIASFVKKYHHDDVDLIVSCQHGESRSAGIAAAVSAYLGEDEMKIFSNPNKIPNMHCYALMCNAFGLCRSETDLRERFLTNVKATRPGV